MSGKFQKGDRIEVTTNGLTGTVTGVSYNSTTQEEEVYIVWDHDPSRGEVCYPSDDVESIWNVLPRHNVIASYYYGDNNENLPSGKNQDYSWYCPKNYPNPHKWVDAGFNHTRMCCYHCGIDKPESK